ncbi:O-methyltransferase [Alloacidobacterium dinghuense]|uniref:O-methyltransferase n=1 Tax=Alloacidobacterium dinghuense TaxID=2763107 RepID=A0A7G8BI03_9BACT|nr:O-methyltransferase [Alloacidobacterium dinghuense]QNI32173.1 O-methyltransferase [Alloacidobacterium dinghuense]
MTKELWTAVDEYINDQLVPSDPALDAALAACAEAELPEISVTPSQGKLLHLLARLIAARNILEIGTLGGYSTIWLARALPADGRLITMEFDPKHAEVASANIANAGLAEMVELREGKALELLPELAAEGLETFDLIFIDADKCNNLQYFDWALRLSHKGTLIIVDNVVRDGAVIEAESTNADIQGVRSMFKRIAAEPRVLCTAQQTVGSKGYDGFAIALVIG